MPLTKPEIRKILLKKRRTISLSERELAGKKAAHLFLNSPLFNLNQHFACYLALDDEFDCKPIIEIILASGKKCYLPILTEGKKLHFVPYHLGDVLRLNRYKIFEPVSSQIFPIKELDLVLVPFVGFDEEGNRLGRGGGYYDRTFSFLAAENRENPFLLGLGYELQQVNHLPKDELDVKLRGVLTEHRLIISNSAIL